MAVHAAPAPPRSRASRGRASSRQGERLAEARQLSDALRQLAAASEAAREEERGRIARELHDELGQLLTGLKFDIGWMTAELTRCPGQPTVEIANKLQAMAGLVEFSMKTVQQIASDLRPPVLDHFGLPEALEWEAAMFEQRTGVRCRVTAKGPEVKLEGGRATAVFRIFQEALTNVARHAGAGAVRVALRTARRHLVLEIRDNGRGIGAGAVAGPGSTGLLGMRERARLLGGGLRITGVRGRGTHIVLKIPL